MWIASMAAAGACVHSPAVDHAKDPASLARSRGALRRALARISGRIVADRSWERIGFARLSDYGRERVGLSARSIQDLAHVNERLATLPGVGEALVDGGLSWTKARLLARVATPEDEADWIAFARRATARELEREVRAIDRGSLESGGLEVDEDGRPTWPTEGIVVRCSPWVQSKFHRVRVVARRVTGEALPTWACMEAVAAEVFSALPEVAAESDEGEAPVTARSASVANTCVSKGAPIDLPTAAHEGAASTAEIEALLDGLDEADAFELDARLRRAVALEQRIDAELAPLLRRLPSLGEQLGISPRKVRALVRLDRAGDRCPALREAFQAGRLSWVQAHALVGLLSLPETAQFRDAWVVWAERVTVRRLYEDVDAARSCRAR